MFIKYTVKYHPIPGHGVIPAPYQLWSDEYKRVVKWGFYLLCLGWWILMIVHMEEFLVSLRASASHLHLANIFRNPVSFGTIS